MQQPENISVVQRKRAALVKNRIVIFVPILLKVNFIRKCFKTTFRSAALILSCAMSENFPKWKFEAKFYDWVESFPKQLLLFVLTQQMMLL